MKVSVKDLSPSSFVPCHLFAISLSFLCHFFVISLSFLVIHHLFLICLPFLCKNPLQFLVIPLPSLCDFFVFYFPFRCHLSVIFVVLFSFLVLLFPCAFDFRCWGQVQGNVRSLRQLVVGRNDPCICMPVRAIQMSTGVVEFQNKVEVQF